MNRFEFAVNAAADPHRVDLCQLTGALDFAVKQSMAEGLNASLDPAVILLGSFVAFQVHADVNTMHGYHKLIDLCNERLHADQQRIVQ